MPTIVRRLDSENNGAVIPLDTRPAVKHRSQRTGYGQVNISPAPAHFPIEQMQLGKFNGTSWELFGPVINGEVGS